MADSLDPVLVQSGGELVTKADLTERVWPRTFIEDGALRVHIAAIRKAFGPDRDMLMTTVGRGYRLRGNWEIRQERAAAQPAAVAPMQARAERLSTNLPAADRPDRPRLDVPYAEPVGLSVVTSTGPGGSAETALALEVARSLLPTLPDCLLVEPASLSNPGLVPRRSPAFSASSWMAKRCPRRPSRVRSGRGSCCSFWIIANTSSTPWPG